MRGFFSPALKCDLSGWSKTLFCGSGLARDAGTSKHQSHRIDAIASKPAPTLERLQHETFVI
ncbi:hypothetical protein F0169_11020 [Pseudomonas sp. MAFF 212408]|uniref:Uncharacterized protein n=1 Tax=Pseudomonas kitaguniensis TaxID=2607908 RepID=A0A5N7KK31_9PSED|nr:hypothetical protein [Pseudomonas kitaguniensis]